MKFKLLFCLILFFPLSMFAKAKEAPNLTPADWILKQFLATEKAKQTFSKRVITQQDLPHEATKVEILYKQKQIKRIKIVYADEGATARDYYYFYHGRLILCRSLAMELVDVDGNLTAERKENKQYYLYNKGALIVPTGDTSHQKSYIKNGREKRNLLIELLATALVNITKS